MSRKLGTQPFDYTLDFKSIDFRKQSELNRLGKGEQGVLLVEPYKTEIFQHWRFKTVADATKSSAKIYKCSRHATEFKFILGCPNRL